MSLKLYNQKRDFSKTKEPKGEVPAKHKHKFLCAIQKHAASHLHYDFRLELNGVLLSWAVPKGPCLDPTVKRLAMHVEDHPVEYGHFEGIIPKGEYGGGTVMLWDIGEWIPRDENPTAAYHKGHLHFTLNNKKLKGDWSLFNFKKDDGRKSWFLVKSKDKYAKPLAEYDITVKKSKSVLSGFNLEQIADQYERIWTRQEGEKTESKPKKKVNLKKSYPKAKMPTEVSAQLATLVDKPPEGEGWLHELKLDGYRILAFKQGKKITLMSRNQKNWTAYFPNVVAELKKLPISDLILDGEIVILDKEQRPSFQLLQNAIGGKTDAPFIYYIFDLLYYDKYQLLSLPLIERKTILGQIITPFDPVLRYSDHIIGSGQSVFEQACKMKLEGIVSKQGQSRYEQKRSKAWLKVKCTERQEFVIGGYSPPKRSRSHFGSLYLGYYDKNKRLIFCGNVGTGFNEASLKSIYAQLQKYKTDENPFDRRPPGVTTATWIKPKLVCEVEFSEWTSEGILRHPSFKGLRTDKPATAITREQELHLEKGRKKSH